MSQKKKVEEIRLYLILLLLHHQFNLMTLTLRMFLFDFGYF